MKTFRKELQEVSVLDTVTCDCCKKEIAGDDEMELQEMLHVNFTGGFTSVFGDMQMVTGDFCQDCVQKLLGPYLKLTDLFDDNDMDE